MSNPYTAPAADLSQMEQDGKTDEPNLYALGGRIGRVRFLAYAFSFLIAILFASGIVSGVVSTFMPVLGGLISLVMWLASIFYWFVYARRRLNDMGRSGWWSLLFLVPLVQLGMFLWLICVPGDEWANDFGPPPAANSQGAVAAAIATPVIVVAVIGILAAIAYPAYKQYTERANAARIQSPPAPALPGAGQ